MKKFVYLMGFLAIFGLFVGFASHAATTGQVLATVTVQNISLTVSDGSVAYGTLGLNSTKNTVTLGDTQLVVNTGNITSDFTIKGASTSNWALGGAAGSETYRHGFSITGAPGFPGTALTLNYATLSSGVASLATTSLDLEITTPTATNYFTQQTASVSVQVTAQ